MSSAEQTLRKIGFKTRTDRLTHVAEEVDEWIHAGVAHRQPVGAEPDDVDVFEAAKIGNQLPFEYVH